MATNHAKQSGEDYLPDKPLRFSELLGPLAVDSTTNDDLIYVALGPSISRPIDGRCDVPIANSLNAINELWPEREIVCVEWVPVDSIWPEARRCALALGIKRTLVSTELDRALRQAGWDDVRKG